MVTAQRSKSTDTLPEPLKVCRVRLGGAFGCLAAALGGACPPLPRWWLCPLWAPLLAAGLILSPALMALWLVRGLRRGGQGSEAAGSGQQLPEASLIMDTLIWWGALIITLYLAADLTGKIAGSYLRQVELFRQGGGAAPDQQGFVLALESLHGITAMVLMLTATLILMRTLCGIRPSLNGVSALRVMIYSLPGLVLICAAAIGAFGVCERVFGMLKIQALAHIMRSEPYFDPAVPFIVLRLYLAGIFSAALGVFALRSLGLAERGPDAH